MKIGFYTSVLDTIKVNIDEIMIGRPQSIVSDQKPVVVA